MPDDFREFTMASRHCLPRQEVPDSCQQFHDDGCPSLVVTGRSDEPLAVTAEWPGEDLPVRQWVTRLWSPVPTSR